jgi:hypothetical protein
MREQTTTSQVFPGEEMIDNLKGLAAGSAGRRQGVSPEIVFRDYLKAEREP